MTVTPEQLRKAEARFQRAFRLSEAAREHREALIRQAINEKMTHAKIAKATGLTRSRIGQLAMRFARERPGSVPDDVQQQRDAGEHAKDQEE